MREASSTWNSGKCDSGKFCNFQCLGWGLTIPVSWPNSGCQLESRRWSWCDSATLMIVWVSNWRLDDDLHHICLREDFRYCCLRERTYRCWCLEEDLQMLMPQKRASEAEPRKRTYQWLCHREKRGRRDKVWRVNSEWKRKREEEYK